MNLNPVVLSASIAGVISLIGVLISFITNQHSIKTQGDRFEKELQRRFTDKLYELRLDSYPKAFEITDDLRGEFLFRKGISIKKLASIRLELSKWNKTKAGFLLSESSLREYYAIRDSLDFSPPNDVLTEDRMNTIWKCKNRFRSALKEDLNLLYVEEKMMKDSIAG